MGGRGEKSRLFIAFSIDGLAFGEGNIEDSVLTFARLDTVGQGHPPLPLAVKAFV